MDCQLHLVKTSKKDGFINFTSHGRVNEYGLNVNRVQWHLIILMDG